METVAISVALVTVFHLRYRTDSEVLELCVALYHSVLRTPGIPAPGNCFRYGDRVSWQCSISKSWGDISFVYSLRR